ncbi:MAG: hypothetical protein AABX13_01395 [Nanoarchaeota archaeon]
MKKITPRGFIFVLLVFIIGCADKINEVAAEAVIGEYFKRI